MDEQVAASLCHELYRMAKADPGMGASAMERAAAICQRFDDAYPQSRQLSERLRRMQMLMQDWVTADGWQKHGHGPAVLRGELIERIAEITDEVCARPALA
ncbi:hypothetical protein [Solimonas sp. K1W22B-7]|uniref:hypothetical protein n=1 Tax=Solimonas sp. K1W22B-7 TaxID=2303331 RepID=UPI0013C506AA|nr:hypothetical protein [Solimonas sp. K1W22B-7]